MAAEAFAAARGLKWKKSVLANAELAEFIEEGLSVRQTEALLRKGPAATQAKSKRLASEEELAVVADLEKNASRPRLTQKFRLRIQPKEEK
jgi:hypothetical protein